MATCWFCYKEAGSSEYHPRCSAKFFGAGEAPVLTIDKDALQALANKTVNQRIAVTGVQPKLSVTLQKADTGKGSRLTIVGLWGEYILKPVHDHFPLMPETEDLTMHIASLFKIPVCDHTLLRATCGNLVYIARRFDRRNGKKVHMEDLCQLSEFLTENKYKSSYEKAGKLILKYCDKRIDIINYFELILFSYLSGNNDMHLKNFSVLHTPEGGILSPAYDLLNVNLIHPADDEELGLTINGKKKRIRRADFVALANTLNIPEKVRDNSFKKFASKNEEVKKLIDQSFLSGDAKECYFQIWLKKQQLFI